MPRIRSACVLLNCSNLIDLSLGRHPSSYISQLFKHSTDGHPERDRNNQSREYPPSHHHHQCHLRPPGPRARSRLDHLPTAPRAQMAADGIAYSV
ncbi:hypothetical protein BDN71DRAFT_1442768 [Pleurotus eryngii]|uniref:Uncharacterized protein n=1 Tax=Pleurotus eryngii TaxID=5323 RepID=A0A9P6A2N9_PLEER|nr:hypothetical protein BDN71DRAFT_1442768 [Pleurotus eryngii]